MQFKKRKQRRSDFAGALAAVSAGIQQWRLKNAPGSSITNGRISKITPYILEIEFKASAGVHSGILKLKGPPRDFAFAEVDQQFRAALVDIAIFHFERLLTREHYSDHYEVFSEYLFGTGRDEFVPDQRASYCRFCDKSYPEVTFKNRAHAVSEMMGNRKLLTKGECDGCNDYFGKSIEKDLADYTHAARTLSFVKGSKGAIPRLLDENGHWSIEVIDGVTEFKINDGVEIFSLSEDEKTATAVIPGKKLTPVGVLKALTKFAISLLPDREFENFREVATWVRNPDHSIGIEGMYPVIIMSFFLESFSRGGAMIWKRRTAALNYPYMSFVIAFGNHHFQTFLPAPTKQQARIDVMPHSYAFDAEPRNIRVSNLAETKKVFAAPYTASLNISGEIVRLRGKH